MNSSLVIRTRFWSAFGHLLGAWLRFFQAHGTSVLRKSFLGLAGLCLLGAPCAWAAPQSEYIDRFDAFITVNKDASVNVTERLVVQAEGDRIQRGIFRVLPYRGVGGYEILSVRRDGRPEPYTLQESSSAKKLYIGQKGVTIPQGKHVYELTYRAKTTVRFQKDFDELYWNVTGNDWPFLIKAASARVTLPEGAEVLPDGVSLYTGIMGAREANARASGHSFFYTTRPLLAGEGFTISVAWNKGVIQEPGWQEKYFRGWNNLSAQAGSLFAWWGLLLGYYAVMWFGLGRDPKARVLRRFEPPADLSPAQTRYVWNMKYDQDVLAVVVMSLVEKKCLQVEEEKGDFTLRHTDATAPMFLPPEELRFISELFRDSKTLSVSQSNYKKFAAAGKAVKDALAKWEKGRYFSRHLWANIPTLVFMGWLLALLMKAVDGLFVPSSMLQAVLFFSAWVYLTAQSFLRYRFPRFFGTRWFWYVWAAAGLVMWLGPGIGLLVAALLVPGVVFFYVIRSYTVQGRLLMNEIEGFLEYLQVAEKYRVFASDPTDASRIFCKYLPYAAALNVQNNWIEALQKELGEAAAEEAQNTNGFAFYQNRRLFYSSFYGAMTAPSSGGSSSGFGGRGSSGGGSGGGGGGGW